MKKILNKRGSGLATIIISLVFVIIALIMVPAFRGFQVDNVNATKAVSNTNVSFINEGLTDAGGGANYQLDTDTWSTTDASNVN